MSSSVINDEQTPDYDAPGAVDDSSNDIDIDPGQRQGPSDHPIRRISQIINPPLPLSATIQSGRQPSVSTLPPMAAPQGQQHPEPRRCRYRCLEPLMPLLEDIIEPKTACDLLEFYFAEPDSALFRHASPYVLSPVIRKQSLLHPTKPRQTTSALLVTILYTCAQTCDIPLLLLPGWRGHICEKLRLLAMALIHERDHDHWHRALGGRLLKEEIFHSTELPTNYEEVVDPAEQPPCHIVDDVLTLILMTIVISGGDFKAECLIWWSKALRLAQTMGLNRIDGSCTEAENGCVNVLCECHVKASYATTPAEIEAKEERRRAFWLIFSLDRHLALSFNGNLYIHDDEVHVYTPLPDEVWENLENTALDTLTRRTYGPPTLVTGTGFYEYFLPLMVLLGDVIETHRRCSHPRLGTLNDTAAVTMIETSLANCAQSINDLATLYDIDKYHNGSMPTSHFGNSVLTPSTNYSDQDTFATSPTAAYHRPRRPRRGQVLLVTSYARFIVNVLHVLLHGKWDAVSMLSPDSPPPSPTPHTHTHSAPSNPAPGPSTLNISNWITSVAFMRCASHAILASSAVETILSADPELTFMPYLLGIYLLHGSFILLLFADRMPQVGPNESVEKACETIIRAHEVCVVTLSTEFQKRFRKVLRGTLYDVRRRNLGAETEEGRARRSALSLYRWTRGSRGLAL
ncbi:uncharacterized protein HMPREF1541_08884 [Cyphellophora europaea CBS 101466]|uniref:Xylanolytic transcriptional activator regulatory domain-containing protein n=1 Tax=Cyphellophora europaea (strain CBS 101466) TaxID=1220924 RepID=W2RJF4_CYPE1|nr:uncharacterized protein HMPREF1541_08884 [Cyphellophora europaea CBS 101466]ETN36606.1 hypothetical protein HMPREF1541_08884 [Cyphellophora europaea CBS 101466]